MKTILTANNPKELFGKVDDYVRVRGQYECLHVEKEDDNRWKAVLDYKPRPLYVGLQRND